MKKTPLKKRNPKRKKREWARAYDSLEFVRFTHRSRSVASGESPCVCAHIKPKEEPPVGMGRKADAKWIIPITDAEHKEMHQIGEQAFEVKHEISLSFEAGKHWARWERAKGEEC